MGAALEYLRAGTPPMLGPIHGDVCIAQEVLNRGVELAIFRITTRHNTNAGTDEKLLLLKLKRGVQIAVNLLGRQEGIFRGFDPFQQDGKFVAPQASEGIRFFQARAEAIANLYQLTLQ